MKKNMNTKQIVGLVVLAALVFSILGMVYGKAVSYSEADLDTAVEDAVEQVKSDMYNQGEVDELVAQATEGLLNPEEVQIQIDAKDTKITELESELASTAAEIPEVEVGYKLDEIEINGTVTKTLSDKHIALFDGEVTFDDDTYDAEESLSLSGLIQKANGNDFKENTFLQIPVKSIEYVFSVENSFNTSKIGVDETLEISLLGKEVEISEWIKGKITLTSGTEYTFVEGEAKEIDGQTVIVVSISDATEKVLVKVGEETHVLEVTDTESFGDLDVYCKEVLSNEAGDVTPDIVTLKIGEDIKTVIEDGAYDEDDDFNVWEWEITDKQIMLTNTEEFMYLDEDDTEFNVLGAGEKLCLPNDYACVEYNGLDEETYEDYKFYISNDKEFVIVKGNFQSGTNDIDKIFIDITNGKIYDDDDKLTPLTNVEFGNSGIKLDTLKTAGTIFTNAGFNFKYDKTNFILYELNCYIGSDIYIGDEEDNYRSLYGAIAISPKDNLEDSIVRLSIPEEQLYGSITVY